jgi:hypothetical protein
MKVLLSKSVFRRPSLVSFNADSILIRRKPLSRTARSNRLGIVQVMSRDDLS